jgi:hypothetical protein
MGRGRGCLLNSAHIGAERPEGSNSNPLPPWSDLAHPGLNLLKPRSAESHFTIAIPFDDCILLVGLLDRAHIPSRPSEIPQSLNAISGVQFLDRWLGRG